MGKQSKRPNRSTRPSRSRTVPMTPEIADAITQQKRLFREKFGREMGADDPVFFDADADTPQEMNAEKVDKAIIEAMVAADMNPSYIYAFKKTGLLVTEENWNKLSPEDQAEWNAAISEAEKFGEQ